LLCAIGLGLAARDVAGPFFAKLTGPKKAAGARIVLAFGFE